MDMPETPGMQQPPKKYCMITLMFGIDINNDAMVVKELLDKAIADKPDKRYTFQIVER